MVAGMGWLRVECGVCGFSNSREGDGSGGLAGGAWGGEWPIAVGMAFPVYIPMRYESRYSLLGAMARQLAEAFARRGCEVNPRSPEVGAVESLLVYFNFLPSTEDLHPAVRASGSRVAVVQFLVDHPLAVNDRQMDEMAELPNFRLFLPCMDGAHLLRLRWPGLIHAHCPHGVGPESVVGDEAIGADREMDLVVTGSVHTEGELSAMRERMPAAMRGVGDEIARLLVEHPGMSFEQAADVVLCGLNVPSGQWRLLAMLWSYATAVVNRERRLGMVRAMQGVRTAVYGAESWREVCGGTIEYRGEVGYGELPGVLSRAKVGLAWGPTQFTHTFSERLLLSMGAGCASVVDDRLMVRREFAVGEELLVHAPGDAAGARACVERLLGDEGLRVEMARRGRDAVARGHLWEKRLDLFAAVGSAAIAA